MTPLLEVKNLNKTFTSTTGLTGGKKRYLQAVNDLSFTIYEGETLGLVGESGCGKSTTGKLILRLLEADSGEVFFRGTNLLQLTASRMRSLRREMQMIFQDPFSSLNPRMRVGDTCLNHLKSTRSCLRLRYRLSSKHYSKLSASPRSTLIVIRMNFQGGNARGSASPGLWPLGQA
jgi:ABC-type oligopeptide transport system ATPase subunit